MRTLYLGQRSGLSAIYGKVLVARGTNEQLVAVLCIECGKQFTCVGDSDAHKQGLCNRCWASMTVQNHQARVGK